MLWPKELEGTNGLNVVEPGGGEEAKGNEGGFAKGPASVPPVDCGACGGGAEAVDEGPRESRSNKSSAAERGLVTEVVPNAGAVGCGGGMFCFRMLGGTRAGGNVAGKTPRPS